MSQEHRRLSLEWEHGLRVPRMRPAALTWSRATSHGTSWNPEEMRPTRFELATFGLKDQAEFCQTRLWEPVSDDRDAEGTGKQLLPPDPTQRVRSTTVAKPSSSTINQIVAVGPNAGSRCGDRSALLCSPPDIRSCGPPNGSSNSASGPMRDLLPRPLVSIRQGDDRRGGARRP